MATVAANVNVAVTGGVYYGPVGTALPTATATALNVAFVEVGYLSEDGITQAVGTSTEDIKAWQLAAVVRTVETEHTLTYAFTLLETNPNTLSLVAGGNYAAGVAQLKPGAMPHKAYVFDILDGTSKVRIVVPDGQITEVGDVTFANGEAIMYPLTVTCMADSSGVKSYTYYSTAGASA